MYNIPLHKNDYIYTTNFTMESEEKIIILHMMCSAVHDGS